MVVQSFYHNQDVCLNGGHVGSEAFGRWQDDCPQLGRGTNSEPLLFHPECFTSSDIFSTGQMLVHPLNKRSSQVLVQWKIYLTGYSIQGGKAMVPSWLLLPGWDNQHAIYLIPQNQHTWCLYSSWLL